MGKVLNTKNSAIMIKNDGNGKNDKITNDFRLYPRGFKGSLLCLKHV